MLAEGCATMDYKVKLTAVVNNEAHHHLAFLAVRTEFIKPGYTANTLVETNRLVNPDLQRDQGNCRVGVAETVFLIRPQTARGQLLFNPATLSGTISASQGPGKLPWTRSPLMNRSSSRGHSSRGVS